MTLRIQRNKRVSISRLPGNYILKLRLIPWIYTKNGCVWLASMAVGKRVCVQEDISSPNGVLYKNSVVKLDEWNEDTKKIRVTDRVGKV